MDFEGLIIHGEAALRTAQEMGVQEGLTLDFKLAAGDAEGAVFQEGGALGKDGRRLLSKALSAFSNAAGGIVVIGVDCRRGGDGIDRIQELKPFRNWRAAVSAINTSLGDMIQPPHDGIRVQGFPSGSNPELGYVAINVPRSERRPHMSQLTQSYFRRTGSTSRPMEHNEVEDAFRRVSSPVLSMKHTIIGRARHGLTQNVGVLFSLSNDGNVSASDPAIHIFQLRGVNRQSSNCAEHMTEDRVGGQIAIHSTPGYMIHPGQSRPFFEVGVGLIFEHAYRAMRLVSVGDMSPEDAVIEFDFSLAARDMRAWSGTYAVQGEELCALKLRES